jgi:elongation factor G
VVELDVEPLPAGSGVEFENKVVGGAVPRQFISAVEAGVRDGLARGVIGEHPVIDVKVTLVDGKTHEVDSSEQAFRTASSMGVRNAVGRAAPILLEPVMRVEVLTPDEYLGDVIGDLSSRSASITGIESRNGSGQTVQAHVPLASMFGYATALRSRTQGRGVFVMEFDHYAEVSPELVRERNESR